MVIPDFPPPSAGPRRISFAHASSLLVAQALADANARRVRHFPAVSSATWGDMLQQLQPDLLVAGDAVTFDWSGLTRRVKGLVLDPGLPALATFTDGLPGVELAADLRPYHRQAAPALTERPASPQAGVTDPIQGTRQHPATDLCRPVPEPLVPSLGPAERPVDSLKESRQGPDLTKSLSRKGQKNTPGPALRRKQSKQRTFRDIVDRHPRGNGKFGFTVRELCTTMRISAASLTEARRNPGHLSVEKVMALAEAMGEHPLRVFADLMTEAAAKKRRERKKRVMPPQRPEISPVQ